MIELNLYEAIVVDTNDDTKKRRIKIRVLPEHKDVKASDLPWASPYYGIGSNDESENDLPIKDSIVGVFIDKYFKRFYYIGNKFFYDIFDFSVVDSAISKASEISNKDYKNIKFRLYVDGGLEFHNKQDGSHGFIHKSGSYSIFDADGNIISDSKSKDMKVRGKNIEIESNSSTTIKGLSVSIAGGQLTVDGTSLPSGSGPFCAIPNCLFTGAPHIGNTVTGT